MSPVYQALPRDDFPEMDRSRSSTETSFRCASRHYIWIVSGATSVSLFFVTLIMVIIHSFPGEECRQPLLRREWRALHEQEKRAYIEAVQCLAKIPSRIGTKYSLYEDFPYIHAIGGGIRTHGTAKFLAWHRYFLHVYERALQQDCGYNGSLTYWDWTLDWNRILEAPVWGSDDFSFGTNGTGDTSTVPGVLRGSCVMDGPFPNTTLQYLGQSSREHCLSRGFVNGDLLHNLTTWLRPDFIEDMLLEPRYETLNNRIEHFTHLAIPGIVQGDLVAFTSPNDPILFLHHAQVDRIWSIWQRTIPGRRTDYGGPTHKDKSASDNVRGVLQMNRLAPDITVAEIMNTRNRLLCYDYM